MRQLKIHMNNYIKCGYCGQFIKFSGKAYYGEPIIDTWSLDPSEPNPICKKCHDKERKEQCKFTIDQVYTEHFKV